MNEGLILSIVFGVLVIALLVYMTNLDSRISKVEKEHEALTA